MYNLAIVKCSNSHHRPKYTPRDKYPSWGVYNQDLKCMEMRELTLSQAQDYMRVNDKQQQPKGKQNHEHS